MKPFDDEGIINKNSETQPEEVINTPVLENGFRQHEVEKEGFYIGGQVPCEKDETEFVPTKQNVT